MQLRKLLYEKKKKKNHNANVNNINIFEILKR